jgi:hypothetical protein
MILLSFDEQHAFWTIRRFAHATMSMSRPINIHGELDHPALAK